MIDKEWLDRILLAYNNYPYPNPAIEQFIRWVYEQYGVVTPEKRDK